MKLMPWLEQKIWPNEAKLTREDVYWGAKLACLEMIKSGTTTFFDMYQRPYVTADAVEEMGLRGYIAARILAGHGIKAENLTGGYRMYALAKRAGIVTNGR